MPTHPTSAPRQSRVRRRLLDAAVSLFYSEGIRSVGVDRIIATADVAKGSFYKHFPTKDDLVRAYVEEQDRRGRAAADGFVGRSPRAKLLAIIDSYAVAAHQPGYRGCPFINAAAEYPDPESPIRAAVAEHRRWLRELFRELLTADGHPRPGPAGDMLILIADGVLVGGELDNLAGLRIRARDAAIGALAYSAKA
ncbi:TetR/AcrR family transcriptional regulator [Leifsonia sp. NPDC058292]|uniref:TetR/AcrR family transcriptional regulator n=1 Tax=Leifsonia sp. NPDC058292 TaxID=3346428 RepID=UPI0036DA95D4